MRKTRPFLMLFFVVFLTPVFAGQGILSAVEAESAPQKNESLSVLQQKAELGDAEAQLSLGFCYDKGEGVPQNYAEAEKWYRKAAEQGHAMAQYNLGDMYYEGVGVPQNYAEAAKWFRKAADQGDTYAQYNLGSMYEKGRGVPQSYEKAYIWFTLAADYSGGELQEDAEDAIDRVMEKLSMTQVMEAEQIVRDWKPKKGK
jgi:TPR repeat protein